MLRCADRSYYVGTHAHHSRRARCPARYGVFGGCSSPRRPVTLVFHQEFDRISGAIAAKHQLKGWSRAKKEALIRGDFAVLPALAWGWTKERMQTSGALRQPSFAMRRTAAQREEDGDM
jgi:putative endonuclease